MKNYVADGKVLTLTAPAGDVVSGKAYKIGSAVVIAAVDADEGDLFAAKTVGVFTVTKATGGSWGEGQKVYWDDSAKKFTHSSSGNTLVGVAAAAAGSSDTTGDVRMDGVAR